MLSGTKTNCWHQSDVCITMVLQRLTHLRFGITVDMSTRKHLNILGKTYTLCSARKKQTSSVGRYLVKKLCFSLLDQLRNIPHCSGKDMYRLTRFETKLLIMVITFKTKQTIYIHICLLVIPLAPMFGICCVLAGAGPEGW